jgi:spermidine synthase
MKKALSFIVPVTLRKYSSKYSGTLELNLVNGKKILDTSRSNYSYGSLQKILHKGLQQVKFGNHFNNVLVLGMGGGSIVKSIREDFSSAASIMLVEIDPEMISIAKNEFNVEKYGNLSIINEDAATFLQHSRNTFDLIVVDLFIIDVVPEIFTRPEFINNLFVHLNPGGSLIFNTLRKTMPFQQFLYLKDEFLSLGLKVKVLEKVSQTNNLLVAEKIALHEIFL